MAPFPWRSVDRDGAGVAVIRVNADDLESFPVFMHHVVAEKVGMDEGVFKVCFEDNIDHPTKLSELVLFIDSYFKTKVHREPDPYYCEQSGSKQCPNLAQQQFYYGVLNEHVYGYKSAEVAHTVAAKQRKTFLKNLSSPDTFSSVASCCVMKLVESTKALENHFWSEIQKIASKSCVFPTAELSDPQNEISKLRKKYCFLSEEADTPGASDDTTKSLALNPPTTELPSILYAPGIPLKEKSFPICSTFSLSNLQTVLDESEQTADGISSPYLYVAMAHSSFPWHTEDVMLFSINYLHYGAPCVWFFVPPKFYKKFVDVVPFFPLDPKHTLCTGVLGGMHKYIVASRDYLQKWGIPVLTVIQQEREIIITYPFAAHSGFKMGWNIQEAANFADQWWVELALLTPVCDCFPDAVSLDLAKLLAICRPDLLHMYLKNDKIGLLKAVSCNAFVQVLGLVPISFQKKDTCRKLCDVVHEDIAQKCTEDLKDKACPSQNPAEQIDTCGNQNEEVELPNTLKGCRFTLQCPAESCEVQYEGGRSKLPRLSKHILKWHSSSSVDLISKLNELYSPKCRKSKMASICPVCHELKFGGSYELKLHMKRKHPGV